MYLLDQSTIMTVFITVLILIMAFTFCVVSIVDFNLDTKEEIGRVMVLSLLDTIFVVTGLILFHLAKLGNAPVILGTDEYYGYIVVSLTFYGLATCLTMCIFHFTKNPLSRKEEKSLAWLNLAYVVLGMIATAFLVTIIPLPV